MMSSFVRPETKLAKILKSPVLYSESFISIVDKNGKLVKFKLNQMQRRIEEEEGRFNIILKSRQGGASCWLMIKAIWLCQTKPNTNCLLLSMDAESTRNVFNKLKQLYSSISPLIAVKEIRNNRSELVFENSSVITCTTLGGKKDKGRGATYSLIHCSEFAFIDQEQAYKQLTSLEQCLNNTGKIYLESTANGFNHYKTLWDKAVNSESSYIPMFFSYLDVADMHKEQHEMAMEVFERKNGKPFTEDLLTKEERDLIAYDERFTLPILCWRRSSIANIGEDSFKQEYPLVPLDAWKSTGSSIFEAKKIHERSLHLPKPLTLSECSNLNPIIKNHIGMGLEIYALPENGERYWCGVDSSEGLGGNRDSSTITILNSDGWQMLQYKSNRIQPHNFAEMLLEILKLYNNALVGVDKGSTGHLILSKLKEWQYLNIAKSKVYDERGRSRKKIGIEINSRVRPILISYLREWIDKDLVIINSKDILNEMTTFVSTGNKIEHMSGSHDDTLFSLGLAIYLIETNHPFYQ